MIDNITNTPKSYVFLVIITRIFTHATNYIKEVFKKQHDYNNYYFTKQKPCKPVLIGLTSYLPLKFPPAVKNPLKIYHQKT